MHDLNIDPKTLGNMLLNCKGKWKIHVKVLKQRMLQHVCGGWEYVLWDTWLGVWVKQSSTDILFLEHLFCFGMLYNLIWEVHVMRILCVFEVGWVG